MLISVDSRSVYLTAKIPLTVPPEYATPLWYSKFLSQHGLKNRPFDFGGVAVMKVNAAQPSVRSHAA